ncbi:MULTISPECIES: S1 family peptidase [Nocardia]|uniref:Alpha-lytic protease n=2 Tax=Nocardia TaxID=1817 RepID=A0A378X541_9NOCA|nr:MULTISPECIES: S1 family peptidase [Nocardia]MBF6245081.1 protease [Nocardia elegans]MBF6449985.1 protease [Nocardia elegans]MCC3317764.1 S1 family peptidase [Nocardia africana]SUA48529.1 Alpha-lytic protease precursor [Nocardia africana]
MLLPRIRLSSAAGRAPRTRLRSAAVAASAAVLVLGPLAATSSADPAPAPAPNLPADLVAAVQRDLKISPEEYLHRADVAQHVAAFTATAQRQFPQAFAGAWLDDAGKAVVALAPGQGLDEAKKAAQDAGFGVKDVAKSQTVLRSEKNAFQQWLSGQPEAVVQAVRGVVIDTVNNSIAVRVDKAGVPMPGFVDPAHVIVMAAPPVGPPESDPQVKPVAAEQPNAPRAGGDSYASVAGKMQLVCSTGFNGEDRNGNPVNITAGHCDPNIPAAGTANAPGMFELLPGNHIGAQLGSFQKSILGNQDYSIVSIDAGSRDRFANNLVRVPGAAPIAITGVADPVVGAPVCKSGSRTGFSCGVVNAVDQTVQVGDRDLTQAFSANICALPGDSGGPIVTGTMALGISSASSVADYPICEIPNLIGALTGDAPQLFAQPVNQVLSDNPGLRVRTN